MQKLFIVLLLAGCAPQPAPSKATMPTFSVKRYDLPDGAYIQTVSMPGQYMANTCVVYVNEKLGRTHMACEVGAVSLEGPEVDSM